jgi:hypothetical protein
MSDAFDKFLDSCTPSSPIPARIKAALDRIEEAETQRDKKVPRLGPRHTRVPTATFIQTAKYSQLNPNAIIVRIAWARANTNMTPSPIIAETNEKLRSEEAIFSSMVYGNGRVQRIVKMRGKYVYLRIEFDNHTNPHSGLLTRTIAISSDKMILNRWERFKSNIAWFFNPWLEYVEI